MFLIDSVNRADCHTNGKLFLNYLVPNLLSLLGRFTGINYKALGLGNSAYSVQATKITPIQIIFSSILYGTAHALVHKYYRKSPKALSHLTFKHSVLQACANTPIIIIKVTLYAAGKNAPINMEDRKERTLYIISSVALAVLLVPLFMKIRQKNYSIPLPGMIKYSLIQITVLIVVEEVFAWNAEKIKETVENTTDRKGLADLAENYKQYTSIGYGIEKAFTTKVINGALTSSIPWYDWMDTAPIDVDQIKFPENPNE